MMIDGTVMSDLAIPPGEYLEEVLAELGMTKEELARRMQRPASKLSHIFNGTKRITEETALQLEKVVGVPAHIWTGLEAEYRLTLARSEERQRAELGEETALVSKFPYKELVTQGQVPDTRKPRERVAALQNFFGVTSLRLVTQSQRYQPAFRCGNNRERSPEAVAAWLCMGERRAQQIETDPYDEKKLRALLADLKALTAKRPEEFEPQLRGKMAACGVALVICPHFPRTYAHGATFRLGPNKAVLMITVRGGWADIFWFSLFHEVGHILLHGSQTIVENTPEVENGQDDEKEREANQFARDWLILPSAYAPFVASGVFTEASVSAFAKRIGVHPGIVVGRLQHDGRLHHSWLNGLRVRLALRRDC